MAYRDLFIDIDRGELVTGPTDSTIAAMPPIVQGDSLPLRIWLLRGYSRLLTEYESVPVAGLTLQVAIGRRVGDETEYYTQQFSWTASDDLAQAYWEAVLPTNTAEITTLLGSGSSATAYFEVKVVEATPRTVLSKLVTVLASVIKEEGLVVPEGLTPLSAEAALVLFLQRDIQGAITLYNEETGYGVRLSCGPAGEFQTEIIIPT